LTIAQKNIKFFEEIPSRVIKRAMRGVLTARKEKAVGFAHGLICSIYLGVIPNAQAAGTF
jgi:hypothetical protein